MIFVEEVMHLENVGNRKRHILEIEWYEASKTILRRKTDSGKEIVLKKKNRMPLQEGDVLWANDKEVVEVIIRPCECIVIFPKDLKEMGLVCFQIGNMHLPIYIDDDHKVLVAYEGPLYEFLQRTGYTIKLENRKLLQTHMLTIHQIKR